MVWLVYQACKIEDINRLKGIVHANLSLIRGLFEYFEVMGDNQSTTSRKLNELMEKHIINVRKNYYNFSLNQLVLLFCALLG